MEPRILLTRLRFIGDVVLTTPAVCSVRRFFPGAHIAYLGEKEAVSLLEHNPHLNEIIPYDYGRSAPAEQLRVARLLRSHRFDLAIDFFGNPRSALLVGLSGARVRVGPDRRGRGRFYTIRVRDDGRPRTAVEFHDCSLRAAGITPVCSRTGIFLTPAEVEEAEAFLREDAPSRGVIALHPGATWPAKHWMPERFAALADVAAEAHGAGILLIAGPSDGDCVREVLRRTRTRIRVAQGLPLRRLAALLSRCRAYVTNDNGTMHMAAAVGTPTVGLFGPGEERIWFPYRAEEGHRALRREVPCHPCHLDVCTREGAAHMECMKLLTVEEVAAALGACMRGRAEGVR
ncbi:MAG: glycosyltransferase family 9 protein [Bacteroidota bacterium]